MKKDRKRQKRIINGQTDRQTDRQTDIGQSV